MLTAIDRGMEMGSAAIAKARVTRISFQDWLERVSLFLTVGGYKMSDFPNISWASHYHAGERAGRVAQEIIERNTGVRSK